MGAGLAVLRDGVLRRTSFAQSKSPEQIMTASTADRHVHKEVEEEAVSLKITAHHFQYAFKHVLPSVSKRDQARYDKLRDRMARARTRGHESTMEDVSGREDYVTDSAERSVVPPQSEVNTNK